MRNQALELPEYGSIVASTQADPGRQVDVLADEPNAAVTQQYMDSTVCARLNRVVVSAVAAHTGCRAGIEVVAAFGLLVVRTPPDSVVLN